ncbi:bursicon-like [Diadema setosum]|uniref:bursicon-like n=1 Tax=Diadema antillarum TaxID=105358 RepID=UPI003A86613F
MVTTSFSFHLLTVVIAILSLTAPSSMVEADCRRLPLQHKLTRPGCHPVTINSNGCRGMCNSYTRISPNNYLEVERSCSCCQELGFMERTERLHCPGLTPNYRDVRYRIPKRCSCRPCRSVASVSRIQRLEDLRQG